MKLRRTKKNCAIFWTTLYNFGRVCLSVSLSDDSFRKPRRTKFISAHPVYPRNKGQVRIGRSLGQGQRYRNKNCRKSLFPQCKTSIGHNSGSIKHRTMRFACSMGFSVMAERMAWPPYLSCDRKYTHSRVVGLRLEGNLVIFFGSSYASAYPPLLSHRLHLQLYTKSANILRNNYKAQQK